MIMVAKILNTQASEKHWRRLVPTRVIHTIWQSIEIPFITSNSFHLHFKIRHRRIYAGIVLHQIAKQVYSRICCMCGETDEHMFLNQQEKKKKNLTTNTVLAFARQAVWIKRNNALTRKSSAVKSCSHSQSSCETVVQSENRVGQECSESKSNCKKIHKQMGL